jgi:hypothetical protein
MKTNTIQNNINDLFNAINRLNKLKAKKQIETIISGTKPKGSTIYNSDTYFQHCKL